MIDQIIKKDGYQTTGLFRLFTGSESDYEIPMFHEINSMKFVLNVNSISR